MVFENPPSPINHVPRSRRSDAHKLQPVRGVPADEEIVRTRTVQALTRVDRRGRVKCDGTGCSHEFAPGEEVVICTGRGRRFLRLCVSCRKRGHGGKFLGREVVPDFSAGHTNRGGDPAPARLADGAGLPYSTTR